MTTISANANQNKSFWESNAGYILRWLGFIPGATVSSGVIVLISALLFFFSDLLDGSIWLHFRHPETTFIDYFFFPFICSVLFGCSFVFIGSIIAPKQKVASLVLSIIVAIFFGIMAFLNCISHEWKLAIQNIIAIISGATTCYYIFNNEA